MDGQQSGNNAFVPPHKLPVSSPLTPTIDPLWNNMYVRQRDRSRSLFQCLSITSQELGDNRDESRESKYINSSEELDDGKRKKVASSIRSDDIASVQKNKAMKVTEGSRPGLTSEFGLTSMLSHENESIPILDPLQMEESNISSKGKLSRAKKLRTPTEDIVPLAADSSPADGEGTVGLSRYNLRTRSAVSKNCSNKQPISDSCSNRSVKNNYESQPYTWNSEFPKSIIRADLRERKKEKVEAEVDISRRDTYWKSRSPPPFTFPTANEKILVPVALEDPLNYARSLAKFTADLGPVAQRVAARKLESILPSSAHSRVSEIGSMPVPIVNLREDPRPASGSTFTNPLLIPAPPTSAAQPVPVSPYLNYGGTYDFNTFRMGRGSTTIPGAMMAEGLPPLPPNSVMKSMFPPTYLPSNNPIAREQPQQHKDLFVSTDLTLKTNVGGASGSSTGVDVDSSEDHQLNLDLQL